MTAPASGPVPEAPLSRADSRWESPTTPKEKRLVSTTTEAERDDEDETEGTPIDVHGAPQALAGCVTGSGSVTELALTGFRRDAR